VCRHSGPHSGRVISSSSQSKVQVSRTDSTIAKVDAGCRTAGIGCIECKKWMFEGMEKVLAPVREKRRQVVESGVSVREILADGTRRAREVAGAKMAEVRDAVRI